MKELEIFLVNIRDVGEEKVGHTYSQILDSEVW